MGRENTKGDISTNINHFPSNPANRSGSLRSVIDLGIIICAYLPTVKENFLLTKAIKNPPIGRWGKKKSMPGILVATDFHRLDVFDSPNCAFTHEVWRST
jgi:hypothetical protein